MNRLDNHSDAELMTLLVTGVRSALQLLYRRHASALYRYARKNISTKEDSEEIIQDVFESLWTRREQLGHVTVPQAYLYQMVKYKVIRYFQHHAVKKKYEEHYTLFEGIYENTQEDERDSSTIQAMIEKSMSKLPERCQLAVRLRLTENLSNSDIARRMNIKKSTVENYMVAALSHLRASFQNFAG